MLVAEIVSENGGTDPIPILVGGATAGFLSWMVTNPFDVVKTIYQSDSTKRNARFVLSDLLKVALLDLPLKLFFIFLPFTIQIGFVLVLFLLRETNSSVIN